MPTITKQEKKPTRRARIKIDEGVEVLVEHGEDETRIFYGNEVISRATGTWIEYCFFVKEYKVCVRKDELEGMLSVG
jgi:hypothetical protein